jgi:hypothetical protein
MPRRIIRIILTDHRNPSITPQATADLPRPDPMHWPLRTGKRLPDNLLLQEMTALHALLIVQV